MFKIVNKKNQAYEVFFFEWSMMKRQKVITMDFIAFDLNTFLFEILFSQNSELIDMKLSAISPPFLLPQMIMIFNSMTVI